MSTGQLEVLSLDEPLLDAEQAAALLNVRPSWVPDATRAGRLPCIRVGRHLRYTRPMLEQWAAPADRRCGPTTRYPAQEVLVNHDSQLLVDPLGERPRLEGAPTRAP